MAYLLNAKTGFRLPKINGQLNNYIQFRSTCEVDNDIIDLMEKCINEISTVMTEEHFFDTPDKVQEVTIITTDTDKVEFCLDDNEKAIVIRFIVYNVSKMKIYNKNAQSMMIVEEFCHLFWNITSEFEVCFKVMDILKRMYPTIKTSDVYNLDEIARLGKLEGKPIPSEYLC